MGDGGRWGVYVHVPWCRLHCPYCAFYVETDAEVPWDRFVDRLLAEHAARAADFGVQPDTVFLGGGTPSRMPPGAIARLVSGLSPRDGAEITAEANPEDVSDAWLDGALSAGITRLSLGVQSFEVRIARRLGRAATVRQARQTAGRVAASGIASWSVDLMFAVPGQNVADLDADLDAILDIAPPHVSLYGLTFEPDTPFDRLRRRGSLVPVDDDTWRAMYEQIVARLHGAGLHRYEVSNFARAGHESAHNRLYWTDRPYMGLGPSAHGYAPDGTRWQNVSDVRRYLEQADPTAVTEPPDPERIAMDLVISAMRGRDGLDLEHLRRRTGRTVTDAVLAELVDHGLIRRRASRISLTEAGYPVADAVIGRLVDGLAPDPAPGPG